MSKPPKIVFKNDLQSDRALLPAALEFIAKNSDDPRKFLDKLRAYQSVSFLNIFTIKHKHYFEKENVDQVLLKSEPKFYEILWKIFGHLIATRSEWASKPARPYRSDAIEERTSNIERRKFAFGGLLVCFNYLLQVSPKAALVLNKSESITAYLTALTDESFVNVIDKYMFENLVFNVASLSKHADANKSDWQKLNGIKTLLQFLRDHPVFDTYVYMIISNIATDKEAEDLSNFHEMVARFIALLKEFKPSKKTRTMQFLDDEINLSVETNILSIFVEDTDSWVSIPTILQSLYHLAVNDTMKLPLYEQIKSTIKALILKHENQIIRQHAVQVLAQLSFDQQVLDDLAQEKELCECITSLSNNEDLAWTQLVKNCQQIEWMLKTRSNKVEKTEACEQFDFMISYTYESRELCQKIKDSLKTAGFKVWIDVEQIYASRIESMAKAIERSKCFLMCVTEKYRQSLNCRAEAEHASRQEKLIIPLILQEGYGSIGGWLGSILNSKISVDFSKAEYEPALKELMLLIKFSNEHRKSEKPSRVRSQLSHTDIEVQVDTLEHHEEPKDNKQETLKSLIRGASISSTSQILQDIAMVPRDKKRKEIETWDNVQVNKWLAGQKIDKAIISYLDPCSGEYLSQLNQLQLYSPQFYFQVISQIKNLADPGSFLKFNMALKSLFE